MAIKALTSATAGYQAELATLENGKYIFAGFVIRSFTEKRENGKKREFYAPALVRVNNENGIESVHVVNRCDLQKRTLIGVDDVEHRSSGDVIDAVNNRISNHAGKNLDAVWFLGVMKLFRDKNEAKSFIIEPTRFDKRSRNGKLYTAAVYKAEFVVNGKVTLDSDKREKIARMFKDRGYETVFALDYSETPKLVDANDAELTL